MNLSQWKTMLRQFLVGQGGSVTVEFVLIFPILMLFLMCFIGLSIYLATLSDVQQLASELTRLSLRYLDQGMGSAEVCDRLSTDLLGRVATDLPLFSMSQFRGLTCDVSPGESSRVIVSYDMSNMIFGNVLARFGFDLDEIRQSGVVLQ